MFASGEGEFERERAVIEGSRRGGRGGGGGEDGEGRSAEDNIMQKLLDKDYAGRRESLDSSVPAAKSYPSSSLRSQLRPLPATVAGVEA